MIQERSVIKVADNSGAKVVRCFRILGGTHHRYAGVGDVIVASVQSAEPRKTVKKKDVVKVHGGPHEERASPQRWFICPF